MATPSALTPEQLQQIIAAGQGSSVNIGGTIYQPQFSQLGGGEGGSLGPLESIYGYTPDQNKVGGSYYQYDPTGAYTRTGTQQEVNANQDFLKFLAGSALTFAVPGALNGSLFGGAATAAPEVGGDVWAAEMAAAAPASEVAAATTAANAATSGLTASQLANLAKAGISVAGLLGASNAISNAGGGNKTAATPITYSGGGAGGYSPDYFSQVQSTYNSLMPGVPRDVASPLQKWYSTEFNPGTSITGSLFGDMTGSKTGVMAPSTLKPVTTTITKPTTTTTVTPSNVTTVTGGGGNDTIVNPGSAGYQYAINNLGWTPDQYTGSINQWILDNPRATKEQQDAALATAGISQADLENALNVSNFSDATKYALTHGGSLQNLGNIIVDWVNANPTATNEQIQAEQAKWGISDQDVANAMYGLNSSAGKEYAVVHDMGLNQYYKNIADAAKSGISVADAVAKMQQYGVSPADVKQAYSMFAPAGGLTLDEVLAAYNK
jgi:hypothetical protein